MDLRLVDAVKAQFRQWSKSLASRTPTLLATLFLAQQLQERNDLTAVQAEEKLLDEHLNQLATTDPVEYEILDLHYRTQLTVDQISIRMNRTVPNINARQRRGYELLASLIQQGEQEALEARRRRLLDRLPAATGERLFGIETSIQSLCNAINHQGPPWIYSLEGMGGIGKTTLADAAVRSLIDALHWSDIAWITARRHLLMQDGTLETLDATPALTANGLLDELEAILLDGVPDRTHLAIRQRRTLLKQRLKRSRCLIVIDNLETVNDLDALLTSLREMAGPTTFILTTRLNPYAYADIYHFLVPDLCQSDALDLIRHEAGNANLPEIAQASDHQLMPIYETVGGNPLALRLVVGQTHIHALDAYLDALRNARGESVANLYSYIYWQSWNSLSEDAKQILLAMPLIADGNGDIEMLSAHADLPVAHVHDALSELVRRNLVDVRRGLDRHVYAIHSLTRTFLLTEVLQWREP